MKITFRNQPCLLSVRSYANNRPALVLTIAETGEPMLTASVNLPNTDLHWGEIAIKNYNENEGIYKALVLALLIEPKPARFVPSGHVSIPVARLTPKGLALVQEANPLS